MLFYYGGNISERGHKISFLKEKVRKYIGMIFFSLKFILSSLTNQRREIIIFLITK